MKIAIIAGEASGDVLGADLMKGLNRASFEGIGGEEMGAVGLQSIFPMTELSVMGIGEVLPRARHLLRRVRETADFVAKGDFDALITIDSPDFSFRVSKRVKRVCPDLPIIHYVAPSVWAWRPKRAKKMARFVDHVLCLLPFEPPYMQAEYMSADFVGHPVAKTKAPSQAARKKWSKEHGKTAALFPGSRKGEVSRHIETYRDAWMQAKLPHKLIIPIHSHLRELVDDAFSRVPNVEIISSDTSDFADQKNLAMYEAEFALATSGTVSFELAFVGTPTIVGYDANWLTRRIFKNMAKIDYASLANILLDEAVIPEFLFENFDADNLSSEIKSIAANSEMRNFQQQKFAQMKSLMQPKITSANSVKAFLKTKGIQSLCKTF